MSNTAMITGVKILNCFLVGTNALLCCKGHKPQLDIGQSCEITLPECQCHHTLLNHHTSHDFHAQDHIHSTRLQS